MRFLTSSYTDTGIKKKTNQDSLIIKVAKTSKHNICMAAVCDGMGGLAKGELASATFIRALEEWFITKLINCVDDGNFVNIKRQLNDMIAIQNGRIANYGKKLGANLGTTLTLILFIDENYLIFNVGDSRVYSLSDQIRQLTNDQTVVAREVERGILTAEQARTDPRRNVLLQCIGASSVVNPEVKEGVACESSVYLVCSDGFRHEISEDEMSLALNPDKFENEQQMTLATARLVDLCKERQEADNISAVLIKTI